MRDEPPLVVMAGGSGRDRRLDGFEDDPFSPDWKGRSDGTIGGSGRASRMAGGQPRVVRVQHVRASRGQDGGMRVEMGGGGAMPNAELSSIMTQLWGIAPKQAVRHHKGNLWHFSEEEKRHLLLATGAFTLALGLMWVRGIGGLLSASSPAVWLLTLLLAMPMMLIAVGPAFLLHEIGHKIVAKRHGCWAEFRADPKGLRFGVLLAALLGFLFMAPGAVMVAGVVTRRQNGHIAVAGPLVNLGLFIVGLPLGALLLSLTNAFEVVPSMDEYFVDGALNWPLMLINICTFWLYANLILGLFNMLPFGPLDGLKVRDWSEGAFYAVLLIFAVPVLAMFFGMWSPIALLQGLASFI